MRNRAFTLIELIIVMAITAILLTLIGIPLIQGLNLTRASQAFAEAQDIAREVSSRISRELSTASLVLDNSMPAAAVELKLPGKDINGNFTNIYGFYQLANAKIDLVPPAKGDPSNPLFNPGRQRIDPTLKTSVGQIILPLAPGQTIIRYWIGLRRPLDNSGTRDGVYSNPWTPVMAGAISIPENLFVLYRAEVAPYVYNAQLNRYVPNTAFFPVDPANGQLIINDPGFFEYTPSAAVDNLNAHRQRFANWLSAARLVVQDSRTDMILPVVDETSGAIFYDGYTGPGWNSGTGAVGPGPASIPRLRSLVSFQPVRAQAEPANANDIARNGEEVTDATARTAPEFFETKMASWTTDSLVRLFRVDPRNLPRPPYFLARWRQPSGGFQNFEKQIVYFDPQTDNDEYNDGAPIFNISSYEATLLSGNPLIGPSITPAAGSGVPLMLFTIDQRRGRVLTRFPALAAWGYQPNPTTTSINMNLTGWLNSPTRTTYNPSGDLARRFIDLKDTTAFAATSPNFNPFQPTVLGYDNPAAKITPGSEAVIGPDERPGPNFGKPIRYTRVAAGETVGLNQYKINYSDVREPNWTALGLPDPNTNPDVRKYVEPGYKKGYIEFHSDPTLPLPEPGNILVSFDFQVNEPADAVVVDYDTNQQIQVEVTIRRFSGGYTVSPQSVTVKDIVSVRNYAR